MKSDIRLGDLCIVVCVCVCVSVPQGRRGDLLLSLCYNPTANIITVNIIKARNLKAMDIGGTSGLFVEPFFILTLVYPPEALLGALEAPSPCSNRRRLLFGSKAG